MTKETISQLTAVLGAFMFSSDDEHNITDAVVMLAKGLISIANAVARTNEGESLAAGVVIASKNIADAINHMAAVIRETHE